MIMSGEITREEALIQLVTPSYNENQHRIDEDFIIKKLNMDSHEFTRCFQSSPRHYSEFDNQDIILKLKDKIKKYI